MSIFLFGCLDIQKPDLILWLNVKCCLDSQNEQYQFYRALITNSLYRYIHVKNCTEQPQHYLLVTSKKIC
jgi:hypothetical protein